MAERQKTEINAELLAQVRALADAQNRTEAEVLDEAVLGYLSFYYARGGLFLGVGGARPQWDTADIGRPLGRVYVGRFSDPDWHPDSLASVFAFVQRWQRQRGVEPPSEEEAMRLAVEEQHAMRNEREARR